MRSSTAVSSIRRRVRYLHSLLLLKILSSIAVQHECIPQAILGMDIVCQAKSGMGKTAVFVLATLQQLDPVDAEVSVLVMAHTRELSFQISKEYERFSKYYPNVKVRHCCCRSRLNLTLLFCRLACSLAVSTLKRTKSVCKVRRTSLSAHQAA